ncbi:hypothetical protein BDQ17DRAFT_1412787 [Cyathus striatus]|nr:hypothetical protein BDQ17DRAFT_1412787 [Cyathus striatus]
MISDWSSLANSTYSNIYDCLSDYKNIHDVIIKPWLYGTIFSGIVYGGITILYLAYVQLLRRQYRKIDQLTRLAWILFSYATLTFILCTLTLASALKKSIGLLNYPMCNPNDTVAFEKIPGGAGTLGNVCFVLTSWTADALLLWRCLIIYHDLGRRKWLVVAFPLALEIASIVSGSLFCHVLTDVQINLYGSMLYYESITLTLNVILIVLIISRLLLLRRRTQKALGSDYGYEYTTVAAMLTESQILMMIAQGVMLAFVCRDIRSSVSGTSPTGNSSTMYQVLAQVQALAPMLVIYRVIQGKAWSSNTFAQITKSHPFRVETVQSM